MREGDTVNVFDRAVAAVAPVHAAKRAAARAALKIIDSGYGNYGANLTKKSLRGWEFYGGSAKEDIEDNIDILRQRSRDAYMGIPTASAALKTMRTNVIAGGLMPAPQIDAEFLGLTPEDAEKLQAQIVREFALWADTPVCDADRVDNFYKLQQLTFLSYAMNGDAIVLLPTKEQTGQPYSLRVRLVEADRVCSPDGFDRLVPCTVQGHDVHCLVQGVETDADGMVVAYWVCDRHPLASNAYTSGGPHWTRVEAYTKTTGRRNVLHVMNRERAGQRRGVPMLAPVLEALKQLGRYTDAEITAAVLGALNTIRENILNLYTKKTGREKDEVAAWMDATSWWTGEEAKTNGFVDELVDDGEKTVVENRGGLLFVNSVNMNLPFDKAPKFVQNSVAAAPAASGFVNTPTPAEQPGNNSHKEDTNMANEIKTVDELRGAYPALVDQIEQAAALRATNAERQRIRDIEEMALPGSEQITNEAKYDKPMSASDYAKAAMKNAKEQGAAWLNTMQQGANASGVNSVGSAPAPTGGEKPDEFMDAIKGLGKKQ